jgi:hypothetical protein
MTFEEAMPSDQERVSTRVAATFAFVLLTLIVSSTYASIWCRGLFQDGVYYLVRICERQWFYLYDPARTTIQTMRQAPVVLMLKLGNFSLIDLARLFSITMLLVPPALVAICWLIVPRDQKVWTLFPLIYLLVGYSTTSFAAVGEAAAATSYFWILLFLLIFRTRTATSRLIFLLLCLPAFQLHEGISLLMPILFLALMSQCKDAVSGLDRFFVGCSALLLAAILIYQLHWMLFPRIPGEREAALHGILSFGFIFGNGHVNLPAVTALLAVAALAVTFIFYSELPNVVMRLAGIIAVIFCCLASLAIVAAWQFDETISPAGQNLSRYNCVFASMVLGLLVTFGASTIRRVSWSVTPTLTIVSFLALAQMGIDLAATWRWQLYLEDFQNRLLNSTGLLDWKGNRANGDSIRDANWKLMTIGWVNPLMSIVLSPQGQVQSILDYGPGTAFRPFDLRNLNSLPRIRGVSYRAYADAEGLDATAGPNK